MFMARLVRGLCAALLITAPFTVAPLAAYRHANATRMTLPGGHIAYTGPDGNLYEVRPDGSGKRALTTDGNKVPYTQPLWAPNGSGILTLRFAQSIAALRSPEKGLWLISPSAPARQISTDVPRGFAWTPDGHSVVYEQGFSPDVTTLVQVDTRTGRKRTVTVDGSFSLKGVTPIGNRAIGVQGAQIEAVSLSNGSARALTRYRPNDGVSQNLAVLDRAGRSVFYGALPGDRLVSLDLKSGKSASVKVADVLRGLAPSPDRKWIAYSTGASAAQSALLQVGKATTALSGASYVVAQAFAPDSAGFVYTAQANGIATLFTTLTSCPATCARQLGAGQDAVWGP